MLNQDDMASPRTASMICLTSIPVLNIYDMTRESENMRQVRTGSVQDPQDLMSIQVPDDRITEGDLISIEKEANKKKRKRVKD